MGTHFFSRKKEQTTISKLLCDYNTHYKDGVLNLENKNLNDNHMAELCLFLSQHPEIKQLNLSKNYIHADGAKLLAKTTLAHLNLNWNRIGSEGAAAFAKNKFLKTLNIRGNAVYASGAIELAKNNILINLNIGGNSIHDNGAIALSYNKNITNLGVRYNQITAIGAKALAANTTLRKLNIKSNDIGDEGAIAFFQKNTLNSLNVSENNISDTGAEALLKNTRLTYVKFASNPININLYNQLVRHFNKRKQLVKLGCISRIFGQIERTQGDRKRISAKFVFSLFANTFHFDGTDQEKINSVNKVIDQFKDKPNLDQFRNLFMN